MCSSYFQNMLPSLMILPKARQLAPSECVSVSPPFEAIRDLASHKLKIPISVGVVLACQKTPFPSKYVFICAFFFFSRCNIATEERWETKAPRDSST